MTIVGDSEEERRTQRELVRASLSFYASTPDYAFIWDEAGFEGTPARIREKRRRPGTSKAWLRRSATTISLPLPPSRRGTAWPLRSSTSTRESPVVLYNALADAERFERYGEVARPISARQPRASAWVAGLRLRLSSPEPLRPCSYRQRCRRIARRARFHDPYVARLIDRSIPDIAVSRREIKVEQVLEVLAVHAGRFGSQHLIMRTVDRVDGDVASGVRPPTLQKE